MAAGFTCVNIGPRNLARWKEVIIPTVYEELDGTRSELPDNYICIGIKDKDGIAGAVVAHIEHDTTDIQIISIYVERDKRRMGAGSIMIKKICELAGASYVFESGEYSSEVFIKTMYALPKDMRLVYEAFLKKNGFTQFYEFKKARGKTPALWGADAQLRIYNMSDGD